MMPFVPRLSDVTDWAEITTSVDVGGEIFARKNDVR